MNIKGLQKGPPRRGSILLHHPLQIQRMRRADVRRGDVGLEES